MNNRGDNPWQDIDSSHEDCLLATYL